MRGRPLRIDWREEEEELFERYRKEKHPQLRTRWHALWLVRQGRTLREVALLVGVEERSMRRWIGWYRQGGVSELAGHRYGGRQGRGSLLDAQQREALTARVAEGEFRTADEAVQWVEKSWGRRYTRSGMYSLFHRAGFKKKVPRPIAAKADLGAQEAWKKGV